MGDLLELTETPASTHLHSCSEATSVGLALVYQLSVGLAFGFTHIPSSEPAYDLVLEFLAQLGPDKLIEAIRVGLMADCFDRFFPIFV